MTEKLTGIKAYMRALKLLRDYIATEFADGGWLPAGRKLAKELDIAYSTYCKALKFLENEGIVNGFPQAGHYAIPVYLYTQKIGLIIESGSESPFVTDNQIVAGTISYLDKKGYGVQFIQGSSIDQLQDSAFVYDVKGIIWFYPSPAHTKELPVFNDETNLPLVCIDKSQLTRSNYHHATVMYDTAENLLKRAEMMLKQGHRSLLYIGAYELAEKSGMVKLLHQNNIPFTAEYCFPNIVKSSNKLFKFIKKHKISAVISEGGSLNVKCLFETLMQLPEETRPEVIASYFPKLPTLHKHFPDINLIHKVPNRVNLGTEAAKMLINHLQNNSPLQTLKLPTHTYDEE